ncbi:transcriptional regulator, DeoR family [Amphibacillus marinus]|uniref:Transcriptional regulator, DeoR family n=1 Tax=Amphibacillus marinus TaxID=872970 RepID=A0A1H8Q4P3_9BACI|nr:DeoR/GlpR family DNA-binding transcription regulator [Amphibacillus marinus]SEO49215.1 transcriptional regulator, DeoR family [Amphibacillus marinus]
MLTAKRHRLILDLLSQKNLVTIKELVQVTSASESTIRRDLSELEALNRLKRVHGGASSKHSAQQELSFLEKSIYNIEAKQRIAKYTASLITEQACLYLDAGTTAFEIIPYLANKSVTVVTNGITHLDALQQFNIDSYLLGGSVKFTTKAIVGTKALAALNDYYFDYVLIGTNGIDEQSGYSTPDPEEAAVKQTALSLGKQCYVIADHSKLQQRSFAKIADLSQATLIIDHIDENTLKNYQQKTEILVVKA